MSADREATIRTLLPMVRTIARRIVRMVPGSDLDDLVGDGCVGLIRAVDAFDPQRGISLEHYARRVVAGAMLNGVRRLDPVSERVRRSVRLAERDRYAVAAQRGAFPAEAESSSGIRAWGKRGSTRTAGRRSRSTRRCPSGNGSRTRGARTRRCTSSRPVNASVWLPPSARCRRQRAIVVSHYFAERSLRVLSDEWRSPQRISQLHRTAIERIRSTALVLSA